MEDSWEGILDILELSQDVREKARLDVLKEFHLGYPEEALLLELYDFMKTLYELDNYFSIVWFEESQSNPYISYMKKQLVGEDDIKFIQNFWLSLSGNYILFLPKEFDTNSIENGDEEELIGKILSEYGQLLLKTPDGNEILYIYLKEDQ